MLTTLGLFATTSKAEQALSLWRVRIPDPQQISVVVQKRAMLLHMAQYEKLDQVHRSGIIQQAPLDRLAGMLVGIGARVVPGLGSVLAVGPLTPIVAKASGGLANALEKAQLPAIAARQIRDSVRQGQVLLALHEIEEGPELMSAAQAVRQYQYPLRLVSPAGDTRHNGELEGDREIRSTELEM
jgi:hypothetical protein